MNFEKSASPEISPVSLLGLVAQLINPQRKILKAIGHLISRNFRSVDNI
jgi:hypothetical protein